MADVENGKGRSNLDGTWRAVETFSDGFTARVLFTFGKGRNSGIVIHSDELFFVPFPSCLTAQGVWKRTDEGKFIATDEAFCFDSETQPFTFEPFGKLKFTSEIRLNNHGNEFNGRMHIEIFDVSDNLLFADDLGLLGVRMRAEEPPH